MWSIDALRHSLRGRLEISLIAGSVVILSTTFVILHVLISGAIYSMLEEDISLRMRAVAAYAAEHPGTESIAEFIPQFRTAAHRDFFQIWDSQGRTLARSDSSAGRDLPRLAAVVDKQTYYDLQLPDGHTGRAVAAAFSLPAGDARGRLLVVTAEETEGLEQLENRIHAVLLLGAMATIVGMLLITRHAVRRGLSPVQDLVAALERVDPDDPQAGLSVGPLPSELRPVAESFSSVLARLLETLAREKRYARNVAHELRTPLAEIRLLADVGSRDKDEAQVRAAIRDVSEAAAEMERTVDSLLALSRYEAGLEQPQPEPMELCAEVRRVAGLMKANADQAGLQLDLALPDEFWVHVDTALLRRLVDNLIGNAIEHSPRGSVIQVQLGSAGELRFSNPAPHLSAGDVPRLGERFFHLGSGRGGAHTGLGLSLAVAIARVIGLGLEFELHEDGCLVAIVSGLQKLEQVTQEHDLVTL